MIVGTIPVGFDQIIPSPFVTLRLIAGERYHIVIEGEFDPPAFAGGVEWEAE